MVRRVGKCVAVWWRCVCVGGGEGEVKGRVEGGVGKCVGV